MCSFVGLRFKTDLSEGTESIRIISNLIEMFLKDKGGDATSFIIHGKQISTYINPSSITLSNFLCCIKAGDTLMAFSRLTPEMETVENTRIPPYKTLFGKYVAAHGTIPMKGIDVPMIDTEMLKFDRSIEESLEKVEDLNGKISMLEYYPDTKAFAGVHNGLGLSFVENEYFSGLTNMIFGPIDGFYTSKPFREINVTEIEPNKLFIFKDFVNIIETERNRNKGEIIVSLCSGGMDALFSTTDYILEQFSFTSKDKVESIFIEYFDWGTRATIQELKACDKYMDFLNKLITDLDKETKLIFNQIDSKQYFKEILKFGNISSVRLIDENAVGGGENEAEEAISYVPLRNTFLLLALVTKYESLYPNEKVTFVFGGNLTEGMVYSDNSVNYIEKMNQLIKVAGQKTSNFKVVAPYSKMTKTKMIEHFRQFHIEELTESLLNIAYSCYFPKEDGKPCGSCGSCLLRTASEDRSKVESKQ